MKINKIISVLLIIIFWNVKICAQEKPIAAYQDTSLDTVLNSLEDIYKVKFSFNTKIIKGKSIKIAGALALQEILQKIQAQTTLFFEKINNRYYIIRENTENATHICGQLINSETGEPLKGASIKKRSNGSITVSDDQGYFYLPLKNKEEDSITISFLGYYTIEQSISELSAEQCKKMYLNQQNQELEEVVIQEYITKGFSKERSSGAVLFNPSKLSLLPRLIEPDILKSVQFLPGIESTTEKASELFIRGSNSDQNLVLWDGIKVYNSGHFFDLLSVFNPYVTESVKVSRSFAALQYDSRVGGVIDITSKNSIPRDIGIGIGSNFTHADIYTEIPLGRKTGLILSGRRSYIDILDTPTEEMYSKRILGHRFWGFTAEGLFGTDVAVTENNNPQYQDYTTKIITDLSASSKLTISGFWHQGESDNKIYLNEDDSLSDFSSTEEDILENQNIGLGINWAKNWGTNFSITASGYYTNVTQEYRNSNFDTSGKTPELIEKFDLIGNLVDFGTSIHLDWQLHKKHTLTLGYNFSEATIQDSFQVPISLSPEDENSGSSFGFTVKNVTHAPYLEDLFKISNTISLSLGGKANYFSIYNRFYFEPRAGLTFLINKNITTNIFAERKHQVIDQRFDIPSPLFLVDFRFWRLRSPELFDPILKSDQISTSFSWNQKNWLIEFEGYYKKKYGIDDASNAVGDNNIIGFGSSDTFGIDLLIKKRIGRYNTWLSYSYIDQTFRFDDFKEKQPFSGSLDITHNISWIHSYLLGNFEFSLGWNIRTGKPYSPLEGITDQTSNGSHPLLFGDVNSKRLDPYHRMDFSASYRFTLAKDSKWRGKAALSIINLYDKKNVLDRRGTILNRENRSIASEFDVISLGFTPNISLRFDF